MAVVEGEVLAEVGVVPDVVRADDGVQDQPPHPLRVELGVDGAQIGAVRVAEVVELLGTERRADRVHVPRGAHRVDVRQDVRVRVAAGVGEGLGALEVGPLGARRVRQGVGAHGVEVPRQAVQRRTAPADPARVEADDVVLGGHLRRQRGRHEPGERQPAAAGAAGVHQQGALERVGGVRDAGQGQRDPLPARTRVVEGDLQGGALERRVVLRGALLPVRARGGRGLRVRRGAGLGGDGRDGPGGDDGGAAQHGCALSHGVLPGLAGRSGRGPRGARSSPDRPGERHRKNAGRRYMTRLGRRMPSNALPCPPTPSEAHGRPVR